MRSALGTHRRPTVDSAWSFASSRAVVRAAKQNWQLRQYATKARFFSRSASRPQLKHRTITIDINPAYDRLSSGNLPSAAAGCLPPSGQPQQSMDAVIQYAHVVATLGAVIIGLVVVYAWAHCQ